MRKHSRVLLTPSERDQLKRMLAAGTASARKLDGTQEAHLIALACAKPPTGQARWSLRLLADKLVELEIVEEAISYQTVRRILKKTRSSRT